MPSSKIWYLATALALLTIDPATLVAQINDWNNTTALGGDWDDPTNWSLGTVPDLNQEAHFNQSGNITALWDDLTGDRQISRLEVLDGNVLFSNQGSIRHLLSSDSGVNNNVVGGSSTLTLRGIELQSNNNLNVGTSALMTIDGAHAAGSKLSDSGNSDLFLGGQLEVVNGGQLEFDTLTMENGSNAGSQFRVQGTNSSAVIGRLDIRDGKAAVVDSGGRLETNTVALGLSSSNPNSLLIVSGANSSFDSESLLVGGTSSGQFGLSSDARATINGTTTVGVGPGVDGEGTLTVSRDAIFNTASLSIGNRASGTLNIQSGGEVHVGGTTRVSRTNIPSAADSFVTLNNSRFTTADLLVGDTGVGTIQVNSNSTLNASNAIRIHKGSLDIRDSEVTSRITEIDPEGLVTVDNGTFNFGRTHYDDFRRILAISGTLTGGVVFTGTEDFQNLHELQNSFIDTSEVNLGNFGSLYGGATIHAGLGNLGEVEVGLGERLRFTGNTNTNAGEIVNLGGSIRFDNAIVNNEHGFIAGRGTFRSSSWENSGVVAVSSGNADILGDFDNIDMGMIITTGGATTTFFDDVTHNGGEIRTSAGSQTVFLGAVDGAGDFTGAGTVFFEGDLRPGNSPGVIEFGGDVVLSDSSLTQIELAGLGVGEYDRLNIAGDLFISGELDVELVDGFSLESNSSFLVFDVTGNLTGNFDQLAEGDRVGVFDGRDLFISYQAGDGNDIALFTAVPEPTSGFAILAVMGIALLRRKKV